MRALRRRLRHHVAASDSGWTLIEMLVVITLILILSSFALTQYRNSVQTAREATLRANLFSMREAIDQYYADKGKYPESLNALVTENYIRNVPKDPITDDTSTWQTVSAPPEPGTVSLTPGVYDVKSGASGTALDGSAYSEW